MKLGRNGRALQSRLDYDLSYYAVQLYFEDFSVTYSYQRNATSVSIDKSSCIENLVFPVFLLIHQIHYVKDTRVLFAFGVV